METSYTKGRDGAEAMTKVDLGSDARQLRVHTYKSNGALRTNASVVQLNDGSYTHAFGFGLCGDYSKTVAKRAGRCTEKSIAALHAEALAIIDNIVAEAQDWYARGLDKRDTPR